MLRFRFDTEGLMVPIGRVHQHPQNNNNGDVDEIVASMLRTGVYRPVYASRASGNIVAGNHTYVAMLDLNASHIPVIWLDLDPNEELVILAADNGIARNARLDPGLTAELLDQIIDAYPSERLTGTGFTENDYLSIIKEPAPLRLSGHGAESLVHTIECPECGHSWVRGG